MEPDFPTLGVSSTVWEMVIFLISLLFERSDFEPEGDCFFEPDSDSRSDEVSVSEAELGELEENTSLAGERDCDLLSFTASGEASLFRSFSVGLSSRAVSSAAGSTASVDVSAVVSPLTFSVGLSFCASVGAGISDARDAARCSEVFSTLLAPDTRESFEDFLTVDVTPSEGSGIDG